MGCIVNIYVDLSEIINDKDGNMGHMQIPEPPPNVAMGIL